MLIRTENHSTLWEYWNLFDTDTGLKYSLCYPTRDKETGAIDLMMANKVSLSINSAHSKNAEDSYSMTYLGMEALDFWLLFDGTSWGEEAHKEATEVLRQIQKEEAKALREERHPELDDLDGIPF